ncbi:MAG: hypothetical protein ACRDRK_16655 [Pseudonocardia sp.]
MSPSTTTGAQQISTVRGFVDPEDLYCPGCGDQAIGVPPAYWVVCDGLPVPGFSHPDRRRCAAPWRGGSSTRSR